MTWSTEIEEHRVVVIVVVDVLVLVIFEAMLKSESCWQLGSRWIGLRCGDWREHLFGVGEF
jgi:hypothetical protein